MAVDCLRRGPWELADNPNFEATVENLLKKHHVRVNRAGKLVQDTARGEKNYNAVVKEAQQRHLRAAEVCVANFVKAAMNPENNVLDKEQPPPNASVSHAEETLYASVLGVVRQLIERGQPLVVGAFRQAPPLPNKRKAPQPPLGRSRKRPRVNTPADTSRNTLTDAINAAAQRKYQSDQAAHQTQLARLTGEPEPREMTPFEEALYTVHPQKDDIFRKRLREARRYRQEQAPPRQARHPAEEVVLSTQQTPPQKKPSLAEQVLHAAQKQKPVQRLRSFKHPRSAGGPRQQEPNQRLPSLADALNAAVPRSQRSHQQNPRQTLTDIAAAINASAALAEARYVGHPGAPRTAQHGLSSPRNLTPVQQLSGIAAAINASVSQTETRYKGHSAQQQATLPRLADAINADVSRQRFNKKV